MNLTITRKAILIFSVLFTFSSLYCKAGDTTAKPRFLTMDSAVALGLSHSHEVDLSSKQLDEVHSNFADIKNRAIPFIGVSASYARVSNVPGEPIVFGPYTFISTQLFPNIPNTYAATASFSESAFNGFLLKNGIMDMEYREKSAEFSLESKKGDVTLNIINTYLALFKLQQAHLLVQESLKQIASHVQEVGDFADHGLATQNDLLRVKLEQSNTELNDIDISNQLLTTNFNLDVMLGIPENTSIVVDSASLLEVKTIQALPYYIQQAGDNRNDIKALDMQQKSAEMGIKETKSTLYPKLNVFGDYNYMNPNPRVIPPIAQFIPTWDLGVRLTYNITDVFSNKSKTDISRAKLAEAQANYAQLTDNAKMEVNQSYLEYQQSLQKIQVADKSLTQAQQNYKLVKSRYDNHISLITDLMDANNYLLNAQINLISSKADAQLAYYKLLKSAGALTNHKK